MRRVTLLRLVLAVALGAAPLAGCGLVGGGGGDGYHLTAHFDRAVGLYPFGDVTVMGLGVGTVDAVEIDDDHVRVEMTIDSDVPLPADVQATIEPLTLIGERNVVLFPPWDAAMAAEGRRRAESGDVIPRERTSTPAEPDEALQAFDELARSLEPATVADLVTGADEALDGLGEELGEAIDQASDITGTLAAVDEQLLDTAESLHVLAGSLLQREEQLGALIRAFSGATDVLASERAGIERFLASIVSLTDEGRSVLDTYGEQLPADIAHLSALALVLDANARAAEQLVAAFPEVAEAIEEGFQPEIGGVYLRANATPTILGLVSVLRDLLGVLPPGGGP